MFNVVFIIFTYIPLAILVSCSVYLLRLAFRHSWIVNENFPSIPPVIVHPDYVLPNMAVRQKILHLSNQIGQLDHQENLYDPDSFNGYSQLRTELSNSLKNDTTVFRPDITQTHQATYGQFQFRLYTSPLIYHMVCFLGSLKAAKIDFIESPTLLAFVAWATSSDVVAALVHKSYLFVLGYVTQYLNTVYQAILNSVTALLLHQDVIQLLHRPTINHSVIALSGYFENTYRRYRLSLSHRPSPSERTYHFGLYVLPHIIQHLSSREYYQFDSTTLPFTAATIYYRWLQSTNRALPYMDLCNDIHEEETKTADDIVLSQIKRPFITEIGKFCQSTFTHYRRRVTATLSTFPEPVLMSTYVACNVYEICMICMTFVMKCAVYRHVSANILLFQKSTVGLLEVDVLSTH